MNYQGWAVFCDCDFIFLEDISKLIKNLDNSKAIYCVKHDYTPKEKHKMDGQKQTIYPRKNWSSFIFLIVHIQVQKISIELKKLIMKLVHIYINSNGAKIAKLDL